MNDYLLSVLLGIIEGLTEFLPVSSTAHLRLAEALVHIDLSDGYWKMYTIVIQLGAILCLPVYFRARISAFIRTFPGGERGDRTPITHPLGLTAVAFVVTAIPAFLLTKVIGKHLESLSIMGGALLVTIPAFRVILGRQHPILADGFALPRAAIWTRACSEGLRSSASAGGCRGSVPARRWRRWLRD